MCFRNDEVHWALDFTRPVQDWELESVSSFLDLLYSIHATGQGVDKMCWLGSTTKGFQVKSYYVTLLTNTNQIVPWKSIWKTKAPTRVAFFVWTTAMGYDRQSAKKESSSNELVLHV